MSSPTEVTVSPTVPDAIATALRDVAAPARHAGLRDRPRRAGPGGIGRATAFPDPWIRQYSVKANDVPAIVAEVDVARLRRQRRLARRVGGRPPGGRPRRPDLPGGRRQDRCRPPRRDPLDRGRREAAAVGRPRVRGRGRGPDRDGPSRRSGRRGRPPLDVLVRLNPEVAPETIAGLAVGDGASKFGMTETEATGLVEWLATDAGGAIRPRGVHLHVGSQLARGRRLARRGPARARGRRPPARQPRRRSTRSTWAAASRSCRRTSPCRLRSGSPASCRTSWRACPKDRRPARLAIEPGRALVARSGWLVARVLHVRDRGGRQVVIDAGMTELIRPALYGARHPIVALTSLGRPLDPTTAGASTTTRADPRRGPHLRVDRRPRHARPAAAPSRRPRGHQPTPARTPPRSPRPTTAGRGRPGLPRHGRVRPDRSSRRCPTVTAILRCDATPRRPAATPHPRARCWPASPTRRRPHRPRSGRRTRIRSTARPSTTTPASSGQSTVAQAEGIVDAIEAQTKAEVAVYTQATGRDDITAAEAEADADALMDQWGVGRAGINDGLVILFDLDTSLKHGQVQLYAGSGFAERVPHAPTSSRRSSTRRWHRCSRRRPRLGAAGRAREGRDRRVRRGAVAGTDRSAASRRSTRRRPARPSRRRRPTGPSTTTPASCRRTRSPRPRRRSTRSRRGPRAEVVVYTQDSGTYPDDRGDRGEGARPDRPVGRRSRRVQRRDGHLLRHAAEPASTARSSCTPRPASRPPTSRTRSASRSSKRHAPAPPVRPTSTARSASRSEDRCRRDARARRRSSSGPARSTRSLGLVGAPVVFLGLSGWAFFHWRRFGKDPVYLDDPSVLMPAPPPDLTAASGAMVMDGGHVATGADHGDARPRVARPDRVPAGRRRAPRSGRHEGRHRRRRRRPATRRSRRSGRATRGGRPVRPRSCALQRAPDPRRRRGRWLHHVGGPAQVRVGCQRLRSARSRTTSSSRGWFGEKPSKVVARWAGRGTLAIVGGVIALIAGLNIPISGLTLIGVGAIAGGIVVLIIARAMPAVTMPGAMIRAMLAAYRRTLQETMAQARSMQQVVDEAGPALAGHARPGRRLGHRPRAPGRHRGRALPQPRGRQGRDGDQRRGPLLPGLVPDLERHAVHELGRRAAAAAACSRTRASRTSAG